ncbi:hypothetical protein TIFTF001_017799 [Ficus carica]|uniref:Uncharacterized protein n=1 Tax=Ficus carica TaxID=3494 RepID=A0AA88A317_FICCA|nr:hypothetical protein TIFTF001_017799 [Ficus carica]
MKAIMLFEELDFELRLELHKALVGNRVEFLDGDLAAAGELGIVYRYSESGVVSELSSEKLFVAANTSLMEILSEASKIVRHRLASGTWRSGDLELGAFEYV